MARLRVPSLTHGTLGAQTKEESPMTCDHPDCTGVHGHDRPRSEWCPNARAADARYGASDEGRAANARYETSEKGRARSARYSASEKGRARDARYRSTVKGFLADIRSGARRRGAR